MSVLDVVLKNFFIFFVFDGTFRVSYVFILINTHKEFFIMTHTESKCSTGEYRLFDLEELGNFLARKDDVYQHVISMYITGYEEEVIAEECRISNDDVRKIIDAFANEVL